MQNTVCKCSQILFRGAQWGGKGELQGTVLILGVTVNVKIFACLNFPAL